MSYTVEVTSIKPSGVAWFKQVNPAEFRSYKTWRSSLPGVVSVNTTKPDENTIVRTYVFEDEAAATNFLNEHNSSEENQLRQAYNIANGITLVSRVIND